MLSRQRLHDWLRLIRAACQLAGLPALVFQRGLARPLIGDGLFLKLFLPVLALVLTVLPLLEWRLHLNRRTWLREHRARVGLVAASIVLTLLLTALPPDWLGVESRVAVFQGCCELTVLVWGLHGSLSLFRRISSARWNAAAVMLVTFLGACLTGALLLMLPICQRTGRGGDFLTCLFTATSAVCVTGLNVVDPGTYWTRQGQVVIVCLIQIGGLGIMTFGAFFALALGRGLESRETFVVGDLLEQNVRADVRRLVLAIFAFTFTFEAIGAALLWGLWPDKPFSERVFFCVFHAVSAFCNAGFGLEPDNFERFNDRWQTWGVLAWLIVLGGIGFSVMFELFQAARVKLGRDKAHVRISLSTRLALWTTGALLLVGTVAIWLLERERSFEKLSGADQAKAAWFQSVTCRTAGFNTVSIGALSDACKFFMIFLMAVGASPGSTGGGLKTVAFAVILLALRAVLRGRQHVEIGHRTIPLPLVLRALLIAAMGLLLATTMTLAVTLFEDKRGAFLDHLFEVVSALATVGLSTGVTPTLTDGSRWVIVLAMFLGRIGPLTLLVALAGRAPRGDIRYTEERVVLG